MPYFYQFPPSVFFLARPFILPFCLLFLYFGTVESSTHLERGKYKCDINSHPTGLWIGLTLSIVRVRMTTLPITINIEDPRQALRRLTISFKTLYQHTDCWSPLLEFLIQCFWVGVWGFAFLTDSQVMLMLLFRDHNWKTTWLRPNNQIKLTTHPLEIF